MDTWMDLAKDIMVYLLLYNIIMNLVQNTSYHKYIGIFLGTILISMIAAPILKAAKSDNLWAIQYGKSEYEFDKKEMETWLGTVEEMQMEMILEEYSGKIKEQVAAILEKNQIEAEEVEVKLKGESSEIEQIEIRFRDSLFDGEEYLTSDEQENKSTTIKKNLENEIEQKQSTDKLKEEIMAIYQLSEEQIVFLY